MTNHCADKYDDLCHNLRNPVVGLRLELNEALCQCQRGMTRPAGMALSRADKYLERIEAALSRKLSKADG